MVGKLCSFKGMVGDSLNVLLVWLVGLLVIMVGLWENGCVNGCMILVVCDVVGD